MERICIICGEKRAYARLINKNPKTSRKILDSLPIEGVVNKWGEEYYFYTNLEIEEENGQTEMEVGDIAYWPEGKAICIFLGNTPISNTPKAISPVNLFAKLEEKIEIEEGEKIRIIRSHSF